MSRHSRHDNAHAAQNATIAPKPCAGDRGVVGVQPATDRIRLRAYEISQARNNGPGNAAADWIQAEREIAAEHVAKQ